MSTNNPITRKSITDRIRQLERLNNGAKTAAWLTALTENGYDLTPWRKRIDAMLVRQNIRGMQLIWNTEL